MSVPKSPRPPPSHPAVMAMATSTPAVLGSPESGDPHGGGRAVWGSPGTVTPEKPSPPACTQILTSHLEPAGGSQRGIAQVSLEAQWFPIKTSPGGCRMVQAPAPQGRQPLPCPRGKGMLLLPALSRNQSPGQKPESAQVFQQDTLHRFPGKSCGWRFIPATTPEPSTTGALLPPVLGARPSYWGHSKGR